MTDYERILSIWRSRHIKTSAELATEMNGNRVSLIYNSGKIENDRITYHDTREIFDHGGVTSYTGDVRTLFEIQNLCAGYQRFLDAFGKKEPLTDTFIREMHSILTQGTYDTHRYETGERPGVYKLHDYVTGVDEVGALPEDVEQEMDELLEELLDVPEENALTAAAYFHAKLENIHPFADGNGRVGRLLMNYILVCHNHPPITIFKEDYLSYYNALECFDRQLELAPLIDFLKEQCEKSWSRYLERQIRREQRGVPSLAERLSDAAAEVAHHNQDRQAQSAGQPPEPEIH